jgi:hypothetical protein
MQGRGLFEGFLARNRISPAEAGRQIGVTRVAVYRWLDDVRTGQPLRVAIENWTRGEVPAVTWLTDGERARGVVTPFDNEQGDEGGPLTSWSSCGSTSARRGLERWGAIFFFRARTERPLGPRQRWREG